MKNSALPYWLALAVVVAATYGGFKVYQAERQRSEAAAALEEINLPPLTDFELTKSDGTPFRSADMKGKVWVATFFFSTCPGSLRPNPPPSSVGKTMTLSSSMSSARATAQLTIVTD